MFRLSLLGILGFVMRFIELLADSGQQEDARRLIRLLRHPLFFLWALSVAD